MALHETPTASPSGTDDRDAVTPRRGFTWAFRAAASLFLIILLGQAVSAGQLLDGAGTGWTAHTTGAVIVLPVAAAVLIVAVLQWRPGRGSGWAAVLSGVLLLATAGQYLLGTGGDRMVHVPLGTVLVAGGAWLVVRAWAGPRSDAAPATRRVRHAG